MPRSRLRNRRDLLIALSLLAGSVTVRAQSSRKILRIGIVGLLPTTELEGPTPRSTTMNALIQGLRALGYTYGEHYVIEPRGADGKPERFPALARELIAARVDVIVAAGPALGAIRQATNAIPVVMAAAVDPVADGLAQSLRRPGYNMTGLSLQGIETIGKQLELLKEIVPGAAPVGVLWNKSSAGNWREASEVARKRGWRLVSLEIREAPDVEDAFRRGAEARVGSVLVYAASALYPHARAVADAAIKEKLPTMYGLSAFVEAGGLVSYGVDIDDVWRRAASFVDKISRGAKPSDLPIEQPTKFELVVNLRTAKALGLTIPAPVLLRADERIE